MDNSHFCFCEEISRGLNKAECFSYKFWVVINKNWQIVLNSNDRFKIDLILKNYFKAIYLV